MWLIDEKRWCVLNKEHTPSFIHKVILFILLLSQLMDQKQWCKLIRDYLQSNP